MALFEGYSLDELQLHLTLLQQAVDLDFQLKDLALQKKGPKVRKINRCLTGVVTVVLLMF